MWLEKTTSFDLWTQQWPRKYFCVSLHNLSMNITLIFGTVYKYFWSVFLVSVKITRPRHHPVNIIILSFRERFQTFSWQVFTFLTFLNSNFNSFTSLSRPILNQYKISKDKTRCINKLLFTTTTTMIRANYSHIFLSFKLNKQWVMWSSDRHITLLRNAVSVP